MSDPYLESLLKGKGSLRKEGGSQEKSLDRFEIEYNKIVKNYLDEQVVDVNAATPPGLRFIKMQSELKDSLQFSELNQHFETLLNVVVLEGKYYLEQRIYDKVVENFKAALKILEIIQIESLQQESLGDLLKISLETRDALFKIAIAKFQEKQFLISFSFFVMLAVFQPEHFDYWYRSGVLAQYCQNYEYALKAYALAFSLNDSLIEARIFSIECYLELNQKQDALAEYQEIERILSEENKDSWKIILEGIIQRINSL